MASSPIEAQFRVTRKGYDPIEVDRLVGELRQGAETHETRIVTLQQQLQEANQRVSETAEQLQSERDRNAAFAEELRAAREQEEAVRLLLGEASKTKNAMLAEAEETLQTARIDAERDAATINHDAAKEAETILADAQQQADHIVDTGRDELGKLEAEAARRLEDLQDEQHRLTEQMLLMNNFYDELQTTLTLVAETAIADLAQAQNSAERELAIQHQRPATDTEPGSSKAQQHDGPSRTETEPQTTAGSKDNHEPATHNLSPGNAADKAAPSTITPGSDIAPYAPADNDPEPSHQPTDPEAQTEASPAADAPSATTNADETEAPPSDLPRLGDDAARAAHDLARSLRNTFST